MVVCKLCLELCWLLLSVMLQTLEFFPNPVISQFSRLFIKEAFFVVVIVRLLHTHTYTPFFPTQGEFVTHLRERIQR